MPESSSVPIKPSLESIETLDELAGLSTGTEILYVRRCWGGSYSVKGSFRELTYTPGSGAMIPILVFGPCSKLDFAPPGENGRILEEFEAHDSPRYGKLAFALGHLGRMHELYAIR